jgi:hypothetical protein
VALHDKKPSAVAMAARPFLSRLNVHNPGPSAVENLITSVHESLCFVDRPVDKKIVWFSFLDSVAGTSARL